MVSFHWTVLHTWDRSSCLISEASVSGDPVQLATIGTRASWKSMSSMAFMRPALAGSIRPEWKAPPTLRAMTFLAPRASQRSMALAIAIRSPLMTIWSPVFTLEIQTPVSADDFLERHLVESDHGGHGSRILVAGFLHQSASLLYEKGGLVNAKHTRYGESRVLAEAVPRHENGLRHDVGIEFLFHRAHAGEADGHYSRLSVHRLAKFVFGALEHNPGQGASECVVNLVEHVPGG